MFTPCSQYVDTTPESITRCSDSYCSETTTTAESSLKIEIDPCECNQECDGVTVTCQTFCTINSSTSKVEEAIEKFTFVTMNNLEMSIITLGARIISLKVPGVEKETEQILLGFDSLDNYELYKTFNIGSLNGKLKRTILDFDQINFEPYVSSKCELVMTCVLREEPEVYSSDLFLQIKYTICKNNTITIEYKARVTRPVLFNIGYRLYMNLAGYDCDKDEMKEHVLFINSEKYYEEDSKLIESVDDTSYDLRIPVNFETIMKDDNDFEQLYLLNRDPKEAMTFVSRIIDPNSGRVLEIYTNQPAVLVKLSRFLPPCKETEIPEEQEAEELEQGDEEQECKEETTIPCPNIIAHSQFPHCFLRHKLAMKQNEDVVTYRGVGKQKCDTCSSQTGSGEELESVGEQCEYVNCGFYFQPFGIPPKCSILKPGQEYHQKVLYKFGYYCPMEITEENDDSCCSDSSRSTYIP